MEFEVTVKYDIDVPEPPKHFKATGGKRASIPITDFTPEALRQIGREWTRNLLREAGYAGIGGEAPSEPEGTVES